MVRGPASHSSRCWLCSSSVLVRWNTIVYFSQLFGKPIGRKLCWDCHRDLMRAMQQIRELRS